MENIFVEFLPPWIETGLQPAFYDKESGTVLQQTARMYARVNMLIRMFNKLSKNTKTEVERFENSVNETVADYIEQFNELHDYVHDYFDNLDVQEEINNKLDDMVEAGTLQEIIATYLDSNAVWGFDTVSDMASATNLIAGSYARTTGRNSINDGYGSDYYITDTNEENAISLGDNLYAVPVKSSVLKFHAISKSSATYVVEFPNGKNMIIDTGTPAEWNDIKTVLDAKGWKFDYGIITHFHIDHKGNLAHILADYVNPNSQWWVQMKPNFAEHSSEINETEAEFLEDMQVFATYGITPTVPNNNSYVNITEDTKLHFLNTSSEWEETYYGQHMEWADYQDKINYNLLSLVTEIIHKNVVILSTGDIERKTEETVYPYLRKCEVLTAPHHLVNRDSSLAFAETVKPDYTLGMHQDPNASFGWVNNWFKSYQYLKEQNTKFITPQHTVAVDGLFTFISDGFSVKNINNNNGDWPGYNSQRTYGDFRQLVNYATQDPTTITLKEALINLNPGSIFQGMYGVSSAIPVIASDLRAIFPTINTGFQLRIVKSIINSDFVLIEANSGDTKLQAVSYDLTTNNNWRLLGQHYNNGSINGIDALITELKKYGRGHYSFNLKDTTNLDETFVYVISVDINSSFIQDSRLVAGVTGIIRDSSNTTHNINTFTLFIDCDSAHDRYKFRKLN